MVALRVLKWSLQVGHGSITILDLEGVNIDIKREVIKCIPMESCWPMAYDSTTHILEFWKSCNLSVHLLLCLRLLTVVECLPLQLRGPQQTHGSGGRNSGSLHALLQHLEPLWTYHKFLFLGSYTDFPLSPFPLFISAGSRTVDYILH